MGHGKQLGILEWGWKGAKQFNRKIYFMAECRIYVKKGPRRNSERAGTLSVFITAESPTIKQYLEWNRYSENTGWIDGCSEGGSTEERKEESGGREEGRKKGKEEELRH